MKKLNKHLFIAVGIAVLASCTRRDEDVVEPISVEDFPQVILLDDEGDGDLEDEDKMSFKVTLLDRVDPSGQDLGGVIVPLQSDAVVNFSIVDLEGFSTLSNYILGGEAFYEIDDCETSADQNIDLMFTLDPVLGTGSFIFPADVEEVEVEMELDPALFDDGSFNMDGRGFTLELEFLNTSENVRVNTDINFQYEVLDDEAIYGAWELDHTDSALFEKFKGLFSPIEEDLNGLEAADVDKIEIEFKYDEMEIVIELVETEMVDDCGTIETENKVIEIAMDYDDLESGELSGDASFEGEVEQDNGSELEFSYEGSFDIAASTLTLTLAGEFDGDEIDEAELVLTK